MTLPAILNGRLSVPAIASPLFIVSNPDLALAQCKAGVVGSFPALNARPQELLDDWLHRMREELSSYDAAHPERSHQGREYTGGRSEGTRRDRRDDAEEVRAHDP